MTSGRAASARIVSRIRAALESGRALTYEELAAEAGCTTRSVRNYLATAESTLGFRVACERCSNRAIRVRMHPDDARDATMDTLGRALARDALRRLFPLAGTDLGKAARSKVQIVVSSRGAFSYDDRRLRTLRRWIACAVERPRVALRFRYDGVSSGPGDRVVWPIGVIVRDLARVYLVGVSEDANDARDVRTYALERFDVSSELKILRGEAPPAGIDRAVIEDAVDLPFSVFPAEAANGVQVHVVFDEAQARQIEGRRWHRRQRMRRLKDGSLDVTFGPADLGEAAAWVRQWGPSVRLVGDDTLRAAVTADAERRRGQTARIASSRARGRRISR